jgi:ketosteroid isomerase-like protein
MKLQHAYHLLVMEWGVPQPPRLCFKESALPARATIPEVGSLSAGEVIGWLEGYRHAWEEADPDAAAALFTEDAVYRSSPFREPHVGTAGIRAYWAVTTRQSGTRVLIGTPIVEGNRVAVEWWATFTDAEDGEGTLPGILFLRFAPDGRCEELREAWNWEPGIRTPHEDWGT